LSRVYDRLIRLPVSTVLARALLLAWQVRPGRGLRVRGFLRLHLDGTLSLGEDVRINSGARNYVGIERRLSIWVKSGAEVFIGNRVGILNSTIIAFKSVEILDDVFIGGGCQIYDTDFHPLTPELRADPLAQAVARPIRIGPRAFVGASCLILKGVTIGE